MWITGPAIGGGQACNLAITMTIDGPNSATVAKKPPTGTVVGDTGCKTEIYPRIQFNTRTVTIQGTRPGSDQETTEQKTVDVTFFSPAPYGTAPDNISVTLKDSTGKVIDGPRALEKKDNTSAADPRPKPDHEAIYDTRYSLSPGNYTICATYVIDCANFEKKAGVPLTDDAKLTYGQSQLGSQIKAVLELNFFRDGNAPAQKIGPYDIRVTRPDGTSQVFQTSSKDLEDGHGSAGTTTTHHEEVTAFMSPFDTGVFRVCVVAINSCQDVTKQHNKQAEIRFNFGDADSQKLIAASTGGGNAQKPSCESTGDPASYLICPIFNGLANLSEWMFESILQPFLTTPPISTDPNDPSFQVWSTFRIYGDIILVFVLLFIVYGETVGGGVWDALAARKALPKFLLAAVLINTSIYWVALLVDLTNIVSAAIGDVLTAPIDLTWKSDAGTSFGVFGMGLMGLLLGSGALITTFVGIFTLKAAFIKSALWVVFFMILPIVFSVLAIFVTLILRKGLLLFLTLVSPVAAALYCFPNTEKYFYSFLKLLFRTLIVAPIIVILFSIGQILSITTLQANGVTPELIKNANWVSVEVSKILAFLVAILLMFVVLGASAWAFKWAGGFIGFADEMLSKGRARAHEGMKSRRELANQQFRGMKIQTRERAFRAIGQWGEKQGRVGRTLAGYGQGRLSAGGLRNVLAESALYRAEQMKVAQAVNDTGDDTHLRALTVNKQWALDNDSRGGTHWRWQNNDSSSGVRQYRTLGGLWVNENDVDQAYKSYGHNQAYLQWSVGHEMEKASTQEENEYLRENFGRLNYRPQGSTASTLGGQQTWNLSDGEMQGMWKGAAFAKQNVNRSNKHYSWKDGELVFDRLSAMREMDEKKGAYELGQTNADYWTDLSQGVIDARQRHDKLTAKSRTEQGLTVEENQQLHDDNEYLQRASRVAGRLQSTGALYATGAEGGPPPGTQIAPGATAGEEAAPPPEATPEQRAAYEKLMRERREAGIAAGSIPRTGEETVRFVREVEMYGPKYTGPAMEEHPAGSLPGAPTEPIAPYGTGPGTQDPILNRAPGFPQRVPTGGGPPQPATVGSSNVGKAGIDPGGNPETDRRNLTPVP